MLKSKYKYVYIHNHPLFPGRKSIQEHRLIMAEYLGRPLLRSEIVHHKDEDTLNNQIDNLEIKMHGEHTTYHHLGRHHTVETRKKMSLNNKRAMLGKHHTIRIKKKISIGIKDHCLNLRFPGSI